jgi:putative sigma-54 modulation protein
VQINISTRHGNLSEASQAKLRSKVDKLHRYFERLTAIEVTVDLTNSELPRVDLNVSAEHKHDFVAHETADSLWGAVDAVIHKMEQQLRRYKERVQERHRNPDARRQEMSPAESAGATESREPG